MSRSVSPQHFVMGNSHKQATELIDTVEKQRCFPLYEDLGRNVGSPLPSLLFSVIQDDRISIGAEKSGLDKTYYSASARDLCSLISYGEVRM